MSELSLLIGVMAAIVAVFLVFREVWCWYWKINVIVKLLTEIRDRSVQEKK
jgi:hypothetical protein